MNWPCATCSATSATTGGSSHGVITASTAAKLSSRHSRPKEKRPGMAFCPWPWPLRQPRELARRSSFKLCAGRAAMIAPMPPKKRPRVPGSHSTSESRPERAPGCPARPARSLRPDAQPRCTVVQATQRDSTLVPAKPALTQNDRREVAARCPGHGLCYTAGRRARSTRPRVR